MQSLKIRNTDLLEFVLPDYKEERFFVKDFENLLKPSKFNDRFVLPMWVKFLRHKIVGWRKAHFKSTRDNRKELITI